MMGWTFPSKGRGSQGKSNFVPLSNTVVPLASVNNARKLQTLLRKCGKITWKNKTEERIRKKEEICSHEKSKINNMRKT